MMEIPSAVAWLVTIVLIEAAIIDGRQLRVPNWLTFHFAAAGLAYAYWAHGWQGLAWSLQGAGLGLLTLLPLYAIGGMGAGDVKLMAGMGAWMGPAVTLGAFAASAIASMPAPLSARVSVSFSVVCVMATSEMPGSRSTALRTRCAQLAQSMPVTRKVRVSGSDIAGSISLPVWPTPSSAYRYKPLSPRLISSRPHGLCAGKLTELLWPTPRS